MASTFHALFGLEVMRLVKASLGEPFRRALSQHESRVRSSLGMKAAELSTQGEVTFVKDSDGGCRVDVSVSSRADLCVLSVASVDRTSADWSSTSTDLASGNKEQAQLHALCQAHTVCCDIGAYRDSGENVALCPRERYHLPLKTLNTFVVLRVSDAKTARHCGQLVLIIPAVDSCICRREHLYFAKRPSLESVYVNLTMKNWLVLLHLVRTSASDARTESGSDSFTPTTTSATATRTNVIRSLECLDVPLFLEELDRRVAWTYSNSPALGVWSTGKDMSQLDGAVESPEKIRLEIKCSMSISMRLAEAIARDGGSSKPNGAKSARVSLRQILSRRKPLPVPRTELNIDETPGVIYRISDLVDCTVAEGYL